MTITSKILVRAWIDLLRMIAVAVTARQTLRRTIGNVLNVVKSSKLAFRALVLNVADGRRNNHDRVPKMFCTGRKFKLFNANFMGFNSGRWDQMNDEETMRLIHYGSNFYNESLFKPIQDHDWIKPVGGLWTSPVNSNWGWKDWAEENNFGNLAYSFELMFKGRILLIDGIDDLDLLPWVTKYSHEVIQFEKLCENYDAIHLTSKGEYETRYSRPRSLYGWDCETVLIMNPDSIATPTELQT